MNQYKYSDSIWDEDEPKVRQLKWAIDMLPLPDKVLMLLYAVYGSSRKVGQLLNVSHNLILKEVKEIRNKIFETINGNDSSSSTFDNVPDMDPEAKSDEGTGEVEWKGQFMGFLFLSLFLPNFWTGNVWFVYRNSVVSLHQGNVDRRYLH